MAKQRDLHELHRQESAEDEPIRNRRLSDWKERPVCINELEDILKHLRDVAVKYPSRYKSLAITNLEQAIMWLNREMETKYEQ